MAEEKNKIDIQVHLPNVTLRKAAKADLPIKVKSKLIDRIIRSASQPAVGKPPKGEWGETIDGGWGEQLGPWGEQVSGDLAEQVRGTRTRRR